MFLLCNSRSITSHSKEMAELSGSLILIAGPALVRIRRADKGEMGGEQRADQRCLQETCPEQG